MSYNTRGSISYPSDGVRGSLSRDVQKLTDKELRNIIGNIKFNPNCPHGCEICRTLRQPQVGDRVLTWVALNDRYVAVFAEIVARRYLSNNCPYWEVRGLPPFERKDSINGKYYTFYRHSRGMFPIPDPNNIEHYDWGNLT